jgi:arylsulfatase A-like enzyme
MKTNQVCSLLLAGVALSLSAAAAEAPNIIVILADDLGYGDLRCYQPASKIPTPHLDRLAAGGVRFTDAHTPSAVCTPTRYGLLTGRYSWRTTLKRGVLDGFDPPLIEPGRVTLAALLKQQGYATACVGKWHLGMTWTRKDGTPMISRQEAKVGIHRGGEEIDYTRETRGGPLEQGFDSWFGISASLDMSPYAFVDGRRVTELPTALQPGMREDALSTSTGAKAPGFKLEEVLPEFTRRAVAFVESRAGKKEPFFLYFPLPSPHLPVVPTAEWREKTGAGIYADFTAQTDATVGAVLAALERTQQAENTLVLFTSDNGGLWHRWEPRERDDVAGYKPTPRGTYNLERGHRSNAGLRGTKADIWEGGHRVPLIVRWPARVKPAVSGALVELNDIYATVAEITGRKLARDMAEDSFSFLPELTGAAATGPRRTFAVHHAISGLFALREGPWKYIPARGSGGFSQPRTVKAKPGEPTTQLYRLDRDLAETRNLAEDEPAVVARLAARLAEIQGSERTRP